MEALENVSFTGSADPDVVALQDINAPVIRDALEEQAIDLDVIDPVDIEIVKMIGGTYVGDDNAGIADAKGCSRLRGPVNGGIGGQVGQRGGEGNGPACPGLVCYIEDDKIGTGSIGSSLVNSVAERAGATVGVRGHGEGGGQSRQRADEKE